MQDKLVMVIDQSKLVQKVCETICKRAGFACLTFSDGVVAMQWMIYQKKLPDLLFLNSRLPRLTGYNITFQIKARFPGIYVVLFIRADVRDRVLARLVGANRSLVKPFRTSDIRRILASQLGADNRE